MPVNTSQKLEAPRTKVQVLPSIRQELRVEECVRNSPEAWASVEKNAILHQSMVSTRVCQILYREAGPE
jgi:hypothetical protein